MRPTDTALVIKFYLHPMSPLERSDLTQVAKIILARNQVDGYTVPTHGLYPFQWNWDSAFIALGYLDYDVNAAVRELQAIRRGQWSNGMIPHITFHREDIDTYFPNWDYWDSDSIAAAPKSTKTSGITQPPVWGLVLEMMMERSELYPYLWEVVDAHYEAIMKYHQWWYADRDPNDEGLVYLYHPWESGRDNSPLWDDSMARIDVDPAVLPAYQRKDLDHADASERPTQAEYDRYVYLMELGKRCGYDGQEISKVSPLMIQDTLTNALLIASSSAIIRVGQQLGRPTTDLQAKVKQAIERFSEKLWHDDLGVFVPYDLVSDTQIEMKEVGGMASLYAGVATPQQAKRIAEQLLRWHQADYHLCPTFDPGSDAYDPARYWRGPVWPHVNNLVAEGLAAYGYGGLADIMQDDTMHLIAKLGFYEYFDARKSTTAAQSAGYGGDRFSWTASTFINMNSRL